MKAKDKPATSTLRLILAAIKDRDIAARGRGKGDGVDDAEILDLLQKMVRQRHDSIEMYQKGNRQDLVEKEQGEIAIIESFLPKQLTDEETQAAVEDVFNALEASTIKDMGRVMGELKTRFAGRMDFAKAGALVKARLS
jgi:hypothetical protein